MPTAVVVASRTRVPQDASLDYNESGMESVGGGRGAMLWQWRSVQRVTNRSWAAIVRVGQTQVFQMRSQCREIRVMRRKVVDLDSRGYSTYIRES